MNKTEKVYEISWHNMITGKSVEEILTQVKAIIKDLELLRELEKNKQIELEELDTWPSLSGITILDKSVTDQVEKNDLVNYYEDEMDNDEKNEFIKELDHRSLQEKVKL